MQKRGLTKLIVKAGLKAKIDTVSHEAIDMFKSTVHKFYERICALFDFYSVSGDGWHFAVRSNAFLQFITTANIVEDEEQPGSNKLCHMHHFDIMFKSVTFQDLATRKMGKNKQLCVTALWAAALRFEFVRSSCHVSGVCANVCVFSMMMRFEFMDMLMRICINKYLLCKSPAESLGAAFDKLFSVNVLPTQPDEALADKDDFRRVRLYWYAWCGEQCCVRTFVLTILSIAAATTLTVC